MHAYRIWIIAGALLGGLAVAAAAYAAHAVIDPSRAAAIASAVQMQGWHALALMFCGVWAARGGWAAQAAGALFLTGTLLFCGAIWVPQFGGPHLGAMAPTGGTMLMLGWLALAASAVRARADR